VCRGFGAATSTPPKWVLVTFTEVPGAAGALPPVAPTVESLVGNKIVTVVRDGAADGGNGTLSRPGVAPLAGTFSLAFRGYATGQLASNAAAADVQAALAALPSVGANVSVSRAPSAAYPGAGAFYWLVTFADAVAAGDVPALVADGSGLLGNGAAVRVCVNGAACGEGAAAVTVRGNQLGGTFVLALGGHATPPLAFDAGGPGAGTAGLNANSTVLVSPAGWAWTGAVATAARGATAAAVSGTRSCWAASDSPWPWTRPRPTRPAPCRCPARCCRPMRPACPCTPSPPPRARTRSPTRRTYVRGGYRLDVVLPRAAGVQNVTLTAASALGGTFTLGLQPPPAGAAPPGDGAAALQRQWHGRGGRAGGAAGAVGAAQRDRRARGRDRWPHVDRHL